MAIVAVRQHNYSSVVSGSFSSDEDSAFAPGMITVKAQVTVSFVLTEGCFRG